MLSKKRYTIVFCLFCLICLSTQIRSQTWDRYSNESEITIWTGVSATHIIRYYFSVSEWSWVDFLTDNLTSGSDTYMHLWSRTENREIAHNDDGQVPSGNPWASRIETAIPPGEYIIFVRHYHSDQYDLRTGRCDLYYNLWLVESNQKFGGHQIPFSSPEGTRFRTINVPSGGDTYVMLLSHTGEMVGFDDDGGGGYTSSIIDGLDRRQLDGDYTHLVVGSYNEVRECVCNIGYTEDKNLEFLSLCGEEQRHVESGTQFTANFPKTHNPGFSTVRNAESWQFTTDRVTNVEWGIDGVDLYWMHSHGSAGGMIYMRNGSGVDLSSPGSHCGVGDQYFGLSGDLEYACQLSCQTVRLEHMQSSGWLQTSGWQTYESNSIRVKGLFEGLHVIVGYHSNHSNTSDSYNFEGKTFAKKLNANKGIWQAWKETNEETHNKYSNWFYNFKIGIASTIAPTEHKDENITNFRTRDIKYGDAGYFFTWSYYGYGDDIPPN